MKTIGSCESFQQYGPMNLGVYCKRSNAISSYSANKDQLLPDCQPSMWGSTSEAKGTFLLTLRDHFVAFEPSTCIHRLAKETFIHSTSERIGSLTRGCHLSKWALPNRIRLNLDWPANCWNSSPAIQFRFSTQWNQKIQWIHFNTSRLARMYDQESIIRSLGTLDRYYIFSPYTLDIRATVVAEYKSTTTDGTS